MFCEYSNIFGKPNEGIHSIRFGGLAIIDVIFTIGAAYLIDNWTGGENFVLILIILFVCGIVLHRLFCVKTTIDKLLFGQK
jgi:hypothetical protein